MLSKGGREAPLRKGFTVGCLGPGLSGLGGPGDRTITDPTARERVEGTGPKGPLLVTGGRPPDPQG